MLFEKYFIAQMNGKKEGRCIVLILLLRYNNHSYIYAKEKEGRPHDTLHRMDHSGLSCGSFVWKMAEKAEDEAAREIRQAEYLQGYELCGDIAACASRAANNRPQCKWRDGKNMGGGTVFHHAHV